MNPEVKVICPFCYQSFYTFIDWSAGLHQSLDLDCEICCHALVLHAEWDESLEHASANTEKAF
ncbi:MAG: CPXCG motif-containing cysteine-rich protein [Bdellovibrionota bacterium]